MYVLMAPGSQSYDKKTKQPLVMKLKAALYGLSQSPSAWFREIDGSLMEISFRPTLSDPCVYIYRKEGSIAEEGVVILTLYVDDILLSGKDEELMKKLKGLLMQRYDMRDMGMEVSRDRKAGTISICLLYTSDAADD